MNSKNFSLFLTALLLCNMFFANAQTKSLRSVVAVVRPVYSESTTDFLQNFSASLKEEGYTAASEHIKSIAKGGFGSGFVYTHPSTGQNYIITNRHVVIQAQYVNVEFMLEDQSVKTFNRCKIEAVDEDHDLAIISLPIESQFDRTLEISTQRPEDGADVYTAGYPALNDKPSWQFGKGIISNSNLHVDEIMIGNVGVIQHTAQIDRGSSGGPLLLRSEDGDYQVVGVNTWKARDRENVNIAVPTSIIMNFINDYFNAPTNSKEILEQQVAAFVKTKNDGYKGLLPFISYDYISHISVKSFFTMVNSANKQVKDEVVNQFKNGFPIEGVRILIADKIGKELIDKGVSLSSIENFSLNEPVQVTLNLEGKEAVTTWTYQQGQWCLSDFPALKVNAEWKRGISKTYGYKASIIYTYGFGNDPFHEVYFQRTIASYIVYMIGFQSHNGLKGGGFGIGGNLPYQISKRVYIVPYLTGFLQMDMLSKGERAGEGFNYGFRCGSDVAILLFKKTHLLVGAGVKSKFPVKLFSGDDESPMQATNFIMRVGLTF